VLAGGVAARGEEARFAEDFSGRYRHVGGQAEERAVREAVERTLSELGWLKRPFARERLMDGSRIPEHIEIDVERDVVTIREDDHEYTAPSGGFTTLHPQKTGRIEVRHDLAPTQLSQTRTTPQGARHTAYRLEDDGRHLVAVVVTTSPHLPAPLAYRLTYERVPIRR